MEQLTPALVTGGLLALLLESIPKLKDWWAALPAPRKQVFNLLLMFVVTILFVLIPVAAGQPMPQGWDWLLEPLTIFLVALAGNQSAHFGTRYLVGSQ